MLKFIFILIFCGSLHTSAQNIITGHLSNDAMQFDTTKTDVWNRDFYNLNWKVDSKNDSALVLYDEIMNLYRRYEITNENQNSQRVGFYLYTPKSNFFTNLFLGDEALIGNNPAYNSAKLELYGLRREVPRDSFNPYGSTDFKNALLGGFLGLFFN